MPDAGGEEASRNHEGAEFRGFHQVLRPMCFQRFFHDYDQ
jgi:hypothetical protein